MVARENTPGPGGDTPPNLWLRLFRGWQLALSRLAPPPGRTTGAAAGARGGVADVLAALHDPGGFAASSDGRRARRLAGAGAAAAAAGALLRIGLAAVLGRPMGPVFVAVAVGACWLVGRYAVFAILAGASSGPPPAHVVSAWSLGLLPYAAAIGGPMPAAAFAVSACLTYLGLRGAPPDGRRAAMMCGVAYGGEAFAVLTSWAVANGLVVIPFLG